MTTGGSPRDSTPDAEATPWEGARDALIRADLDRVATIRQSRADAFHRGAGFGQTRYRFSG